jgi:hypothetical protein
MGEMLEESQKERDHWEDQDVGEWKILKWILERMGWYGMDWIDLTSVLCFRQSNRNMNGCNIV